MSEFKAHRLICELLDLLGSKASPEEFLDVLQKNQDENKVSSFIPAAVYKQVQSLAKRSPNPELFLTKFQELKEKNADCLGPFIQLLHRISDDQGVKSLLSKTAKKPDLVCHKVDNLTKELLPNIRTRLLEAVAVANKSSNLSSVTETGNKVNSDIFTTPSISAWVSKRPAMSWDFSNIHMPLCTLEKVPVPSQESAVCYDIISVLTGIDGNYIEALPLLDPQGVREFKVSQTMNIALREMVKQLLPLASYYSTIQRFVEEKSKFEYGQVNNALASAMRRIIKDYIRFMCQLDNKQYPGKFDLHALWFFIQPYLHTMGIVANIVTSINKSDARGGKVLTLLHDKTGGYIGDEKAEKLCLQLTQAACVPYMRMLALWIYQGVIYDPMKEFLVEDNEIFGKEDMPTDYSADYWEKRYTVRRERIPKFLDNFFDKILRTGKYLNVIRQCGKTVSNKMEPIEYTSDEYPMKETISKAYLYASKTLLDLIMNDNDLMGRLRSVKHYFLLDLGDFIMQFMYLAEKELKKQVSDVVLGRLETLLEIALRLSTANSDPYKDDLRPELLQYDLEFQMCKILSYATKKEKEFRSGTDRSFTGLESLAFAYKVKWPVSLILNHKALTCYQMIFRHLFYCKHMERMICQVWRANRVAKKFPFMASKQYRAAFALRQRMLHCVQNLEYHMMVEVIEPNWIAFVQKVNGVSNVDEVISCHNDFMDACLKDCMLTSPLLLRTVTKLMGICQNFCEFIQDLFGESSDSQEPISDSHTFEQTIKRFDKQFGGALITLLNLINETGRDTSNEKLFNLLYRLDFNSYYTGKLERLYADGTSNYDISG